MTTLLVIVLAVLMALVVYSLVRGIIAFLQSHKADIDAGGDQFLVETMTVGSDDADRLVLGAALQKLGNHQGLTAFGRPADSRFRRHDAGKRRIVGILDEQSVLLAGREDDEMALARRPAGEPMDGGARAIAARENHVAGPRFGEHGAQRLASALHLGVGKYGELRRQQRPQPVGNARRRQSIGR